MGGHCENSITVLLCQAVLALFVHLNCPDILCHLQPEVEHREREREGGRR